MENSEGMEGKSEAVTSNGDSAEAEGGKGEGGAVFASEESGMEMEIDQENNAVEPESDTGWTVVAHP